MAELQTLPEALVPDESVYADVNGVRTYYETYGAGTRLATLPGTTHMPARIFIAQCRDAGPAPRRPTTTKATPTAMSAIHKPDAPTPATSNTALVNISTTAIRSNGVMTIPPMDPSVCLESTQGWRPSSSVERVLHVSSRVTRVTTTTCLSPHQVRHG